MIAEVDGLIDGIVDEGLRSKVRDLLHDPNINLDFDRIRLEECPGGSYVHHSYRGGLLEHTVSVTRLALTLCDLVTEVYGGRVDRDSVLAGALLHDVMKCYVYVPREGDGYVSSPLGERIDHLTLLVAEMYERGFPLDVIHVAASHHGDQSPIKPKTVEALIVSIADLADSELSRNVQRAAEYLLKQATGEDGRGLSSREALEIVRAKAEKGLEGVRRLRGGKAKKAGRGVLSGAAVPER